MQAISPKFSLNIPDFLKSFAVAAISQPLLIILTSLAAGHFNINWTEQWHLAVSAGAAYLIKNYFSGAVAPSNGSNSGAAKIVGILIGCLLFSSVCSAQNFFQPLPKAKTNPFARTTSVFGTNQWNFRPVVNVIGYSVPGNQLSTGGGVAYELDTYDAASQKWTAVVSFSALAWYNVPLAQQNPANIIGYGVAMGLFNNLIMVGYKYDGKNSNIIVGVGINFNN